MTAHVSDYPLFVPPGPLADTEPRSWSAKQADDYLNWITEVLDQRTDFLLSYFKESGDANPEALLGRIGPKIVEALRQPAFSTKVDGKAHLTNRGYALAADMGLLVARLLLATSNSSEQWAVLRRPKSDAFYNHPVLTGFGPVPFEPVGGSIAEAHAVLRGDRRPDVWKRMYAYWHNRNKVAADSER